MSTFNTLQKHYENQVPEQDYCPYCDNGDCSFHNYHECIWVRKVSTHKARKDDLINGIKKGDYYKAYFGLGVIVDNGEKTPIKEYCKIRTGKPIC